MYVSPVLSLDQLTNIWWHQESDEIFYEFHHDGSVIKRPAYPHFTDSDELVRGATFDLAEVEGWYRVHRIGTLEFAVELWRDFGRVSRLYIGERVPGARDFCSLADFVVRNQRAAVALPFIDLND